MCGVHLSCDHSALCLPELCLLSLIGFVEILQKIVNCCIAQGYCIRVHTQRHTHYTHKIITSFTQLALAGCTVCLWTTMSLVGTQKNCWGELLWEQVVFYTVTLSNKEESSLISIPTTLHTNITHEVGQSRQARMLPNLVQEEGWLRWPQSHHQCVGTEDVNSCWNLSE